MILNNKQNGFSTRNNNAWNIKVTYVKCDSRWCSLPRFACGEREPLCLTIILPNILQRTPTALKFRCKKFEHIIPSAISITIHISEAHATVRFENYLLSKTHCRAYVKVIFCGTILVETITFLLRSFHLSWINGLPNYQNLYFMLRRSADWSTSSSSRSWSKERNEYRSSSMEIHQPSFSNYFPSFPSAVVLVVIFSGSRQSSVILQYTWSQF